MTQDHTIIITTVAKTHGAHEVRLRQLAHEAAKALDATTQVMRSEGITVSLLTPVGLSATVAVATDLKTGWFVQLVDQKDTPRLITIGRKFCISGYDTVNQTAATQMYNP